MVFPAAIVLAWFALSVVAAAMLARFLRALGEPAPASRPDGAVETEARQMSGTPAERLHPTSQPSA